MTEPHETYPAPRPGHDVHQDRPAKGCPATEAYPRETADDARPGGASLHTEVPDPPPAR